MNEDRRRTVLLMGAIAGAAGLVIGAFLFARRRTSTEDDLAADRSVSDVLSDCYSKVREIQSHLTELAPVLGVPLPESA